MINWVLYLIGRRYLIILIWCRIKIAKRLLATKIRLRRLRRRSGSPPAFTCRRGFWWTSSFTSSRRMARSSWMTSTHSRTPVILWSRSSRSLTQAGSTWRTLWEKLLPTGITLSLAISLPSSARTHLRRETGLLIQIKTIVSLRLSPLEIWFLTRACLTVILKHLKEATLPVLPLSKRESRWLS